MTLELPWPPTANNLHAVVRGRKVLSRKGREYRAQAAAQLAMQAAPRLGYASEKAAIDALVYAGVLHDDSQIDRLTIVRAEPRAGGALTVTIEEIPGDP
ncbi:MAG TPA: hypothetical protein VF202_13880 [Trueperaceae bacterium]